MQNQLTEMDVQNLRELITRQDMQVQKFRTYAQQCQHPELRSYLDQVAQKADEARNTLLNHLQ